MQDRSTLSAWSGVYLSIMTANFYATLHRALEITFFIERKPLLIKWRTLR
jgi:hypothetical protein